MDTPFADLQKCTLENLAGGAAEERFQYCLRQVTENIADLNTDAEKARKITIDIAIVPMMDRSVAGISVNVTSKLVGLSPVTTMQYLVERNGETMMVGRDVRQVDAFLPPVDPSIRPLTPRAATTEA